MEKDLGRTWTIRLRKAWWRGHGGSTHFETVAAVWTVEDDYACRLEWSPMFYFGSSHATAEPGLTPEAVASDFWTRINNELLTRL